MGVPEVKRLEGEEKRPRCRTRPESVLDVRAEETVKVVFMFVSGCVSDEGGDVVPLELEEMAVMIPSSLGCPPP